MARQPQRQSAPVVKAALLSLCLWAGVTPGSSTAAEHQGTSARAKRDKKPARPAPSSGPLGIPSKPNGDRGQPATPKAPPSTSPSPNRAAPPSPDRTAPPSPDRTPPPSPDRTPPPSGGADHQAPDHGSPPSGGADRPPPDRGGQPSGADHQRPDHGSQPSGGRPYEGPPSHTPPARGDDHRYGRPDPYHVRPAHEAGTPPPPWAYYRPYYTRWYVHPYYRSLYATWVVVSFPFVVYPWVETWAPPPRAGWVWVPGHTGPLGYWVPGHWEPMGPPPAIYTGAHYVYVPGWWQGGIYIDGYWRISGRSGWVWQDGVYGANGAYTPGYWRPSNAAPDGYVWEPGWFDGDTWIEGFWRPNTRAGYTWVSGYFDEDSVYHGGYWRPIEDRPGYTWVPGWFDGGKWVDGYWVAEQEYKAADPQTWTPPEGWDDGHDSAPTTQAPTSSAESSDGPPLAVPVNPDAP